MNKRSGPSPKPLTKLETLVMGAIWDLRQATAAEITEAIKPQRMLATTTVHTVLGHLMEKDWVRRVARTGRAYVFEAAVSRQEAGRRSLRELVESVFGGSVQSAMLCLLRDDQLTAEEREELLRLIGDSERGVVRDEDAD